MSKNHDNKNNIGNIVFVTSELISIVIAIWAMVGKDSFTAIADLLMQGLKSRFSWLYLGVMLFFVLFAVGIAASKYGRIKLGADDEEPEYSLISWFAMLFAAGMGIGLVFWGIAEPLSHYAAPMKGVEPLSEESARFSIRSCFMHWGLHPWACYAIMGLSLAYFQFRKKENALISNLFKPLFGRKKEKRIAALVIDSYTTILTVIGVATSFGMGCLQICGGLDYLFGIPDGIITWLILIVIICCCYLKSSVSGVGKGIRLLSDFNLFLFLGLMVLTFLVGPGREIGEMMFVGIKDYAVNFFSDSLRLSSQGDASWIQDWRVFYWAWWLSWAPFVGVFIARISKGRTIRQFIVGVMLIPTIVSILWFSVMGGTAVHVSGHFSPEQLAEIISVPQTALFIVFHEYEFGVVLSLAAAVLIITFFITSADSATFVLAMLTSNGELEPPDRKKIFWGILIAVMAFALILSGGISGIQTIAIVIAFPFLFILLLLCFSLIKEVKKEKTMLPEKTED